MREHRQILGQAPGCVGWDELMLLKPRASPGTMSSSSKTTAQEALLAQLAEQLTLNQRVVGSSPTGGISASDRQDTSKRVNPKGLRRAESPQRSSQGATESDTTRPSRATRGATRPLPDDPDLAAMVAAWPELPEAIRAGLLAMVRAASGSD